jgi:O-antigen/teichoic acid export membrane protein
VLLALAGALVAYAACECTLRRVTPTAPAAVAVDRAGLPKGWARRGAPLAVMGAVAQVDAQLAVVAVGVLRGPRDAGLFAAAAQATFLFALARAAAARPLLPLLARWHADGAREALQGGLTRGTRWVLAATVAAGVLLCAFAGPIMGLFGAGFSAAAPTLRVLVLANIVNAWVAFNATTLTATGHGRALAGAATASLAVNLALLAILVPRLGVVGAAVATLASTSARNMLNSTSVRRRIGVRTSPL